MSRLSCLWFIRLDSHCDNRKSVKERIRIAVLSTWTLYYSSECFETFQVQEWWSCLNDFKSRREKCSLHIMRSISLTPDDINQELDHTAVCWMLYHLSIQRDSCSTAFAFAEFFFSGCSSRALQHHTIHPHPLCRQATKTHFLKGPRCKTLRTQRRSCLWIHQRLPWRKCRQISNWSKWHRVLTVVATA